MATDNATITQSEKNYSQCLGVAEWWGGVKSKDGTWSTRYKTPVIADTTETITIERGLTSCSAASSSIQMDTARIVVGSSIAGTQQIYDFDYVKSQTTSECHRSSEAGFYVRTTVTRTTSVRT